MYAQPFPERTDRIMLDSNLGPSGYDRTAIRLLGRGQTVAQSTFSMVTAER
ncbi:hypothetical protein [Kibdelosporangium philippinense]|uniref:hypothetical protein n=1 Tax=Kibdelosporangium philippinense TaxID=211113 RepID=UPI003616A560